ncbi:Autophagy-related protein 11 [Golovinomyces cichoracearum]|uniref:Autophagy-related protein 11 n=1 Tax=Golovinomyces cichoracearum TaxID=62708 RepID=A0A420J3B8_9PEZI|nr:Autophagy-related protein 11 [Golovinomyces cichoracearum]
MSLKVFIAHTGQCLLAEPETFKSLESFRIWISNNCKIGAQDQIHLNKNGKHAKFASLANEKEIFIYDRHAVQSPSTRPVKLLKYDVISRPPSYQVTKPPDTISDQNDLEAWKLLFKARKDWALNILADCSKMSDEALRRRAEVEVIIRAASTAVSNIQKHVTTVDQKNKVIQNWVEDVRKVQESTGNDWNALIDRSRGIPVADEVIRFITGHITQGKQKVTLEYLINVDKFVKSKDLVGCLPRQLSRSCADLERNVKEIYRQSDELVEIVSKKMHAESQPIATLEPLKILQEIEALANKVSFDCEDVLQSQNPSILPQASKLALVHTKMVLPNLMKRSMEMSSLIRSTTEIRNSLAASSMETMQRISSLTSIVSEVTSRLTNLEPSEETYDALQTLLNIKLLPVTYASFLAEGIRRKQWVEKIRTDSTTLASEMKIFQEEEARRRRKWQKSVGATLWGKRIEQNFPELELKIHGLEENWPKTSKQDLEDLFNNLHAEDPNSALTVEVSKIISDLCNPTKEQIRWAKAAFKAGSVHESTLGHSTLMFRGDNELIRILQEEGQKTSKKLKTAESRVRRLENLLHQQTQVNCTVIGRKFQLPNHHLIDVQKKSNETQIPSLQDGPAPSFFVSSPPFSTDQAIEEKTAQEKLLILEAELAEIKEKSSNMAKEICERDILEEGLKNQIEEANSTKKDLLNNLDAQQREFIEERKSLTAEIRRIKSQKEDLENDLDRYQNSAVERENYSESKEFLTSESTGIIKDKPQIKISSDKTESEETGNSDMEFLFQKMREENDELKSRTKMAEQTVAEHQEIIQSIYRQFLPHNEVPDSFNIIIEGLKSVISELTAEIESVNKKYLIVQSENDQIKKMLVEEKYCSSRIQEALVEHCSKFKNLEAELNNKRLQLSSLEKKYIDIENEFEILQNRLVDEEKQVSDLKDDVTAQDSRIKNVEKENGVCLENYESLKALHEKLNSQLKSRSSKAKDLTHRLYSQNDRLCRLLERLSYTVIREDKSMVIRRLPKTERSTANDLTDPNCTFRRSIPADIQKIKLSAENRDLESLNWMCDDNLEEETQKYDLYLMSAGYIDTEAFCETISKRVKDLEYAVKKYSRDARLYREKSHTHQKEAQGKIAFKNFKEGDLALFLPTRNQAATGAWAAFNVGAPHYFLKEHETHKLRSREWLLARIHKIEDRVVDLSKSFPGSHLNFSDRRLGAENSICGDSIEDDNPFDLSDGLRWYLIEAAEEKLGAPSTPGLGKCTVASANIDATGSIRRTKKSLSSGMEGINRTLSKNLRSRRDSNNSKKSLASASSLIKTGSASTDTASLKVTATTLAVEGQSEVHIISPNGKLKASADQLLVSETTKPD